jgi:hypothetical protein
MNSRKLLPLSRLRTKVLATDYTDQKAAQSVAGIHFLPAAGAAGLAAGAGIAVVS